MSATPSPESVPQAPARTNQLGALDLGSNSFHLLVAQEVKGRIQIIDKHKEMVRLAEGLREDNSLDPKVAERALDCLQRFAQRLRTLDPANVRIVGTNTLRKARASGDFLHRAEQIMGHKIEVISGREEARLIYLGVCHDLGGNDTRRLVVDIGGGSTELILGRRAVPETLESLHMGCVSMSKRHFGDGIIDKRRMQRAITEARSELEPVALDFVSAGWEHAVGASGTVNAIRDVASQLGFGDGITLEALSEIQSLLIQTGATEEVKLQGLSQERRAVFPGGVAILSAIFEALQIERMTAAQSALREGVIYDLLGRQHHDDTRDHTVNFLMQRYHVDQTHAHQVRDTAIGLLSQVAMAWKLTDPDHKLLLGWAANLHEIGMDIAHSSFHKHGSYLLENMDMPGFSRAEQSQLAVLVRTHRRKLSTDLFVDQPHWLTHLSVLLRLASRLHRNRAHEALPHLEASATENTLFLSLPEQWIETRPLTMEDLKQEAGYLKTVGITLTITNH